MRSYVAASEAFHNTEAHKSVGIFHERNGVLRDAHLAVQCNHLRERLAPTALDQSA